MGEIVMTGQKRCVIYSRISRDREGKELGVERQIEDLIAYALERGYIIVGKYCDNDISASRYSKKPRPDFDTMLKATGYDVIIAYTSGRLTRRPAEFERLVEVALTGRRIEYIRSPAFDLGTADGRMVARVLAAADAAECDRISERTLRQGEQRRRAGKPFTGGHRLFGFTDSHYRGHNAREADAVRWAMEHIGSGGLPSEVSAEFTSRGLAGAKGSTRWTAKQVHSLIKQPLYAGLMADASGALVVAQGVPPIVPRGLWEAAQEAMATRAAGNRAPRRRYLLSGLVRCHCGGRMKAQPATRHRKGTRHYTRPGAWVCTGRTPDGGWCATSRRMELIDEAVGMVVRAELARSGGLEADAPVTDPVITGRLESVRAQIAGIRRRLATSGNVAIVEILIDSLEDLVNQETELVRAVRHASAENERASLLARIDAEAVWADIRPEAIAARRALLTAIVSGVDVAKLPSPLPGGISRREAAAMTIHVRLVTHQRPVPSEMRTAA